MTAPDRSDKQKRRSPISREEGERRLVAAAIELVREKPFSEVGVRDIAARADVNHGFVHTWFGSKNELLKRAVIGLFDEVSRRIAAAPAGTLAVQPFDPDVQLVVRIVTWLKLEGVDLSDAFKEQKVVSAFSGRYETVEGMDPEVARIAAQQIVAIGIAAIAFGDFIGITTNEDLAAFFAQWRHIVGLLVEHPPA